MKAKRQIESSLNSGTMLDGTGGHVNALRRINGERAPNRLGDRQGSFDYARSGFARMRVEFS